MQETKCLVPQKLITVVDNIYVNGKRFPEQSQWNYDRIEEGTWQCCDKKDYYIVKCGDVEYPILTTDAVIDTVVRPEFAGRYVYENEIKYQWEDQEVMKPCPEQILKAANTVKM